MEQDTDCITADEELSVRQQHADLDGGTAAAELAAEDARAREHMAGPGAYPAGEDDEV